MLRHGAFICVKSLGAAGAAVALRWVGAVGAATVFPNISPPVPPSPPSNG